MRDIADKADSTAGSTGELTASEYNDHKNELQGAVTSSGQTLSSSETPDQLSRALFIYATSSERCIDSSSVDTVVLSPLTGASGLQVPEDYAEMDGMVLSFNKTTANTTTSVSVNFGQTGTELGAKTLVRSDGSVPQAGDVIGECLIRWDNANDQWVLIQNGSNIYTDNVSDTDVYTPTFSNTDILGDVSIGDAEFTLSNPTRLGQKVHVIADGSGVLHELTEDVYITANTGGAYYKSISDGVGGYLWTVENGITADYDLGGQRIVQSSNGDQTIYIDTTESYSDTLTVTTGTIGFSFDFTSIETFTVPAHSNLTSLQSQQIGDTICTITNTTYNFTTRGISGTFTAGTSLTGKSKVEGKYK